MKKNKVAVRRIKWLCINGAFAAVVYFGFFDGIDGARNIAMFWAWVTIIASFFMLSDEVIKKMSRQGGVFPASVRVTYDVGITLALVWSGAWVTSIFYSLSSLIQEVAWDTALAPEECGNAYKPSEGDQ